MNLLNTLRVTFRQLRKSPGFTVIAVLSLGLGIGAGTAVFSVVNAILLSSLPVPHPDQLRIIKWNGTDVRMTSFSGGAGIDGGRWTGADVVPPPTFARLREQGAGQAEIFGFSPVWNVIGRGPAEAFTSQGAMVSDNYFAGVGVRPLRGRLLGPEDFAGAFNVVISYDLWEKQFAFDPSVLGQTLALNRTGYTIVGVLPRDFPGLNLGQPNDFYVPMSANCPFLYRPINDTFHWCVNVIARLRPGVSDSQLAARLDVAFAGEVGAIMKESKIVVEPGRAGIGYDRVRYRKPLFLMLGVVGLVMLVACANLAGLSLARGAARQHELAVRAALGAGRWRLIRQSLTESLVLALFGGLLGVLVAIWLKSSIAALLTGGSVDGLRYNMSLDRSVLVFTLATALVTALLSGLLPALRAGRVNALGGLKSRGALGRPRLKTGRVLVAVQVCLSILLVAGAALYLRTLVNLTHVDPGFSTERMLLFQVNLRGSAHAEEQPEVFYGQVQEALANLPGVRAASFIEFPLLGDGGSTGTFNSFSGRSRAGGATMTTSRLRVGETFFATMGIPLLRGRGFTATDDQAAPKVIVVNEAFAQEFLPGENPIGLSINIWDRDWRIVGVCRNAKYTLLRQPAPPTAYFPFRQMFYSRFRETHLRSPYFAVRTALPPMAVARAVRKAVAEIDNDVPITEITTQEEVRDRRISGERLFAILCGGLALLAVLLASVGLYGLLAYNVARSTGEIGIRMALGATQPEIVRRVLREAALLSLAGAGIGLPAALALTRFVENQLYGVRPNDPVTLAGAAVLLIGIALLAAWIPARRAAKVDPIVTLRCE